MPNLFVFLTLFIGLFVGNKMGGIFGIIFGIILDLTIGNSIGFTSVFLGIIGLLGEYFDKNFSKDSRFTIMLMVAGLTIFYELIFYFANYFVAETSIEIFTFIKILLIEVIYNVILTIILYPLMQKFGYYIENEFKGNKILTRYF